MLQLTPSQVEVLSDYIREPFESRLEAHLREYFSDACAALESEGLRDFIRRGVDRAISHQITRRRDICKFLQLVITFGEDFDRDLAWASDILVGARIDRSRTKIDLLYDEARYRRAEAPEVA